MTKMVETTQTQTRVTELGAGQNHLIVDNRPKGDTMDEIVSGSENKQAVDSLPFSLDGFVGNNLERQVAELEERGIPATIVDGEVRLRTILDNDVSREPWPWAFYVGLSKLQRVILYILDNWDYGKTIEYKVTLKDGSPAFREIPDPNIWQGAVRLGAIEQLLFKGKQLTNSRRASLSQSISRLEKEGLVNRQRGVSNDGYTTHIELTARGSHQAWFERDSHSDKQWYELLTFFGLKADKYRRKVNKIHKRVNRG